ncbi:unnamed protein product [Dracunculus medinensis]|uniref:Uncharacterized protein n=1 Tax=Dracunculus medinensis TaxID=318479 RepID=A0A3P7SRK0_DRAME|nr:unnamed protein product [Dracunculus medinensis]
MVWKKEILPDDWSKVILLPILKKGHTTTDSRMCLNQAGLRPGRTCFDQIFMEHRFKYQQYNVSCFIDFAATFDSVDRMVLWRVMERVAVPDIVRLIKAFYQRASAIYMGN